MFDLHDIDYHLFDYLSDDQGKLAISKFLQALRATGLRESDPRLKEAMTNLSNVQNEVSDLDTVQNVFIDRETFRECIADNIILIAKAFRNQFIIPEFTKFTNRIDELFWRAKANTKGKARAPIAGLEPATEGSLQISGRTRKPLCYRRSRPPQGDLRLPGPPSGLGAGGELKNCYRMVPVDLRAIRYLLCHRRHRGERNWREGASCRQRKKLTSLSQ
ncbi:glutaminase kidney isoform, mitochondrial [Plakobranchus ocellatus]|uniref:Glutaminase kidney isoform, mitochondrial n=1 Tax=Plakobranchus ocellatus TaxID=259542 RepID=A0AAV4DLF5_9GAST|nr:glutaminase kidney isoform, mitochondrial [Plakobranchus ocellatus]